LYLSWCFCLFLSIYPFIFSHILFKLCIIFFLCLQMTNQVYLYCLVFIFCVCPCASHYVCVCLCLCLLSMFLFLFSCLRFSFNLFFCLYVRLGCCVCLVLASVICFFCLVFVPSLSLSLCFFKLLSGLVCCATSALAFLDSILAPKRHAPVCDRRRIRPSKVCLMTLNRCFFLSYFLIGALFLIFFIGSFFFLFPYWVQGGFRPTGSRGHRSSWPQTGRRGRC
jgi:hypothetical protein